MKTRNYFSTTSLLIFSLMAMSTICPCNAQNSTISSKSLGFTSTTRNSIHNFDGETLIRSDISGTPLYDAEITAGDIVFGVNVYSLNEMFPNIKSMWESPLAEMPEAPFIKKLLINGQETITIVESSVISIMYIKNDKTIGIYLGYKDKNKSKPLSLEEVLHNLNLDAKGPDPSDETSYYISEYAIAWKSNNKIEHFREIRPHQGFALSTYKPMSEIVKEEVSYGEDRKADKIIVDKRIINGVEVVCEYCKITKNDQIWKNRILSQISFSKNGQITAILTESLLIDEKNIQQTINEIFSSITPN